MAYIINIETSTTICSASLSNNGQIEKLLINEEGMNHAKKLPLFVEELLKYAKEKNHPIDAVSVSAGPGSYTGLRIGVSTAKGLCYGLKIPLISIDTLAIIASPLFETTPNEALICPMIDARRMEVYTAIFNNQGERQDEYQAKIIDNTSFLNILERGHIYFCGNGSDKCQTVITHPNAHFVKNIIPSAENMAVMAEHKFQNQLFEDVAYFEPFYLKEFQVTTSKKKLF